MKQNDAIGLTQSFVIAKGFTKISNYDALIGSDNTKRLFLELFADRDRSDVFIRDAYSALLGTIHAGWTIRILQAYWPDETPRKAFLANVSRWRASNDGLSFLKDALIHAAHTSNIPFGRRTFLELVVVNDECIAFWDTIPAILQTYGIQTAYNTREEIENLSYWVFNANVETGTLEDDSVETVASEDGNV